ncbi:MAG TPA: radical SAM protein [bacterium]|nr:radical SAM protein [bacterium]HOL48003.1 radical SAM protein [bacterium]HPQ18601.1 radical SAM protein [bacterium]
MLSKNELNMRLSELKKLYENCELCERRCGINRYQRKGYCRTYADIFYVKATKHFGEEPCISGRKGSGTIFFSNCNLSCVFCQNYEFSQLNEGIQLTPISFCAEAESLIKDKVHNINLVSPTQYWPAIVEGLSYIPNLSVPIINNTNTYESEKLLELLDGIVDIHLADFKYYKNESAIKYSNAPNYVETVKRNLKIMYKSVGPVKIKNGIAQKGIILRHLVMPGLIEESKDILKWLYEEFENNILISLMAQYHPTYKAQKYPEINRYLYKKEYEEVVELAVKLDFENIYIQEINPTISKLYLGG